MSNKTIVINGYSNSDYLSLVKTPLTIIAGGYGKGKTTLLKRMAAAANQPCIELKKFTGPVAVKQMTEMISEGAAGATRYYSLLNAFRNIFLPSVSRIGVFPNDLGENLVEDGYWKVGGVVTGVPGPVLLQGDREKGFVVISAVSNSSNKIVFIDDLTTVSKLPRLLELIADKTLVSDAKFVITVPMPDGIPYIEDLLEEKPDTLATVYSIEEGFTDDPLKNKTLIEHSA